MIKEYDALSDAIDVLRPVLSERYKNESNGSLIVNAWLSLGYPATWINYALKRTLSDRYQTVTSEQPFLLEFDQDSC